jgi:hypothetical protein
MVIVLMVLQCKLFNLIYAYVCSSDLCAGHLSHEYWAAFQHLSCWNFTDKFNTLFS